MFGSFPDYSVRRSMDGWDYSPSTSHSDDAWGQTPEPVVEAKKIDVITWSVITIPSFVMFLLIVL